MTAVEDAAERAVAAVILFGDLNTAADIRKAAKAIARNVVSEVEPIIRANEYEMCSKRLDDMDYFMDNQKRNLLSTLYGQVEAMDGVKGSRGHPLLYRKDVLALIDGSGE
jgi:hypothetical protein